MNVHVAQELLNELGSSLETLETKQDALLQFLKDKGIVSDDQLAPYLDQAGKASDVRWRAARARLEHLLSAEDKEEQRLAEKERAQEAPAQTPVKQQEAKQEKAEAQGEGSSEGDGKPKPAGRAHATEVTTKNLDTKPDAEEDRSKDTTRDDEPGPKQEKNAA